MTNNTIMRMNNQAKQLYETVIRVQETDTPKTIQNAERNEIVKLVAYAQKHNVQLYKIIRQHPSVDGIESKNILLQLVGIVGDAMESLN
jgi:hypothetical protein